MYTKFVFVGFMFYSNFAIATDYRQNINLQKIDGRYNKTMRPEHGNHVFRKVLLAKTRLLEYDLQPDKLIDFLNMVDASIRELHIKSAKAMIKKQSMFVIVAKLGADNMNPLQGWLKEDYFEYNNKLTTFVKILFSKDLSPSECRSYGFYSKNGDPFYKWINDEVSQNDRYIENLFSYINFIPRINIKYVLSCNFLSISLSHLLNNIKPVGRIFHARELVLIRQSAFVAISQQGMRIKDELEKWLTDNNLLTVHNYLASFVDDLFSTRTTISYQYTKKYHMGISNDFVIYVQNIVSFNTEADRQSAKRLLGYFKDKLTKTHIIPNKETSSNVLNKVVVNANNLPITEDKNAFYESEEGFIQTYQY